MCSFPVFPVKLYKAKYIQQKLIKCEKGMLYLYAFGDQFIIYSKFLNNRIFGLYMLLYTILQANLCKMNL